MTGLRPLHAPLALAVLLAAACAADAPTQRATSAPTAAAAPLTVPLTFEVPERAGPRRVHVPMVHATVGGVDTLLILDTGATDHVFTRDLAERIGLSLTPTEAGTDHAGAEVMSWRASDDVPLAIAGHPFTAPAPVVIEGPPPFAGWNVGGFLSPQGIAPDLTLVLDFVHQTMTIQKGAAAPSHPGLFRQTFPLVPASGDAARLLIVSAAAPGDTPLRVLLNCGGKNAEFTSPLVEGSRDDAPARATGRGVSGTAVMGHAAAGGTLRFGEATMALTDIVIRDQGEHYDAQLGMPMLAGTVLVVPPRGSGTVTWWIPSPMGHASKQ